MSADGILTDPTRQVIELRQVPYRTVNLPGGAWRQVATPDPQRLTLTVAGTVNWGDVVLLPEPIGTPTIAAVTSPQLPLVVHAAAYPLLISGQWWAWSVLPQTLAVWDVTRES